MAVFRQLDAQRSQGRFQSVREIGDVAASMFKACRILIDKGIQLGGERHKFIRLVKRDMPSVARADLGQGCS